MDDTGRACPDRENFEQIYIQYKDMLFRTARLMTGSRYDAEDILQDTFVIAFEQIPRLRDPDKLKPWLFRIMINRIRRAGARSQREKASENVEEKLDQEAAGSPSGEMENLPQRIDIQRCLLQIEPKLRETAVLFYYDGFSIREIAGICRCPEGTVKSRLNTVRKQMKQKLEQTEAGYGGREAVENA